MGHAEEEASDASGISDLTSVEGPQSVAQEPATVLAPSAAARGAAATPGTLHSPCRGETTVVPAKTRTGSPMPAATMDALATMRKGEPHGDVPTRIDGLGRDAC